MVAFIRTSLLAFQNVTPHQKKITLRLKIGWRILCKQIIKIRKITWPIAGSVLSLAASSYLFIRFYNNCRRLLEAKRHSSLFLHCSGSKFPVVMAACTPSINVSPDGKYGNSNISLPKVKSITSSTWLWQHVELYCTWRYLVNVRAFRLPPRGE